ncbi:MAG: Flp pilus assembly protein CpaB [Eubacteriales bacterium]
MKNKLILVLAILVALVAAGGAYMYLENVKDTYRESGDFVKVVVAKQRIPAKTQVTAQMLEMKDIPARFVNNQATLDFKEVVGKIARSEILTGEQVLRDRLAKDRDVTEGLSLMIQPGKRAVTISVTEVTGVAGMVRPGDHVDVLGTFDVQGAVGQEKTSLTTFVIQNIEVLSVDQTTDPGRGQDAKKAAAPARTFTLSVTPEQAQPLVLASEKSSIRLALRPGADHDAVNIPSAKLSQLIH